jgi:hypothetical protein
MIPDIWSGLVWYRSITLLWYRSMYDERLGHVWNNSDTIWCVRTICMSPSRRALELVRAGGVWRSTNCTRRGWGLYQTVEADWLARSHVTPFWYKMAELAGFGFIWSEILGGNKSHWNDPNSYLIDLVDNARLFDYASQLQRWHRSWKFWSRRIGSRAGLPDFFGTTYPNGKIYIPNGHKMYQMAIRYTKKLSITPNGHKMYQHFPFLGPPKYTQIGIFWVWKYPIWQPCSRV